MCIRDSLYTDPNETDQGTAETQLAQLLHLTDLVRVGLAGNLAGYTFTDASGATVTGADVDYNGSPAGYTADQDTRDVVDLYSCLLYTSRCV